MEQKYRISFDSNDPDKKAITTQTKAKTTNLEILAVTADLLPPVPAGAIDRCGNALSTLTASAAAMNRLAMSTLSSDSPRAAHSPRSFRVVSKSI